MKVYVTQDTLILYVWIQTTRLTLISFEPFLSVLLKFLQFTNTKLHCIISSVHLIKLISLMFIVRCILMNILRLTSDLCLLMK